MAKRDSGSNSRQAALDQLIQLFLHRHHGHYEDPTGFVASSIRSHYGLPPSISSVMSNVLIELTDTGIILKESRNTRTFSIRALRTLTDEQAAEIAAKQQVLVQAVLSPSTDNRSLKVRTNLSETQLDDETQHILPICRQLLEALARKVSFDTGYGTFNMNQALKDSRIADFEEASFYLSKLGLIKNCGRIDGSNWRWFVAKTSAISETDLRGLLRSGMLWHPK